MKIILKSIFLNLIIIFSAQAGALYPMAAPCNPSPYGTFCELNVKVKPTKKFRYYAYCGNTFVMVTKHQRDTIEAYLRQNKKLILRYKLDDEFIDAPCTI